MDVYKFDPSSDVNAIASCKFSATPLFAITCTGIFDMYIHVVMFIWLTYVHSTSGLALSYKYLLLTQLTIL